MRPANHGDGSKEFAILKIAAEIMIAFTLTAGSALVQSHTDERAMYGYEGALGQNWLPREVAGWPAPFLADSPHTSVLHKIGPEDEFRPGPFIASLTFWFLLVLSGRNLVRRIGSGRWR